MTRHARPASAFLLVTGVLLACACTKERGGGGTRVGRGGPAAVRTESLASQRAPRFVTAWAPFEGVSQTDVYSKVTGRLSSIGAQEGSPVKAGDVLFRVDRSDPGDSFLNVPVLSPLNGWIGWWQVRGLGTQITPAQPVVTLVDDRALRAQVALPIADWTLVHPGIEAVVKVRGEERALKVEAIARAASPSSGRGNVTVRVENPKRDWRAGELGEFRFSLEPAERLLLSSAALVLTERGAFLYVAEDGKAKRRQVEFRVVDNDTIEITSGVPAGAEVIVAGTGQVSDGAPVRLVDAQARGQDALTK